MEPVEVRRASRQSLRDIADRLRAGFPRYALRMLGLALPLVVWDLLAHYLASNTKGASIILPTIEQVVREGIPGFSAFWQGGGRSVATGQSNIVESLQVLALHSAISSARLLVGVLLGILVGIGIGLIMGWSRRLRSIFYPAIEVIRISPLLAFMPLFILWFGGSETSRIFYILFGAAIVMIAYTNNAIENVHPMYVQFARTLGASRTRVYQTVVLPAIVPELVAGIRVAIGLGWALTLGAEFMTAQAGLGRLMLLAEIWGLTDRIIVIAFLFMAYAFVLDQLFVGLSRRVTRWKP